LPVGVLHKHADRPWRREAARGGHQRRTVSLAPVK
jgi:hypothetical protein